MSRPRPHPHDVSDRRLRPIYEAIDERKFKKAHQLADKLIKKKQDAPTAKALKGLVMLRTGHEKEAYALMDEIMKKRADLVYEPLLQAVSLFYRESHQFDRIADVFELAVAQEPNNEDYMNHLFMAYVRVGKYQKQQEVGRNLFKMSSKNSYYYWTVMSIVMQAHTSKDQRLAKTMYLPLAQKMIEKQMKTGTVESDTEVKLYVSVLDMQEKYEDALFMLRGVLGGSYKNDRERELLDLSLVKKLRWWPELNRLSKAQLNKNPDEWTTWQYYVESLIAIIKIEDPNEVNEKIPDPNHWNLSDADVSLEQAYHFIKAKVDAERVKKSQWNRGPFLAPFELIKQATEKELRPNDDFVASQSLVDLFVIFFDQFGSCRSCHSDVDPYLVLLSDEEKEELIKRVTSSVSEAEKANCAKEDLPRSDALKVVQRHIFSVQLARSLGEHEDLTVADKLDLVEELKRRLKDGERYRDGFIETDVCPIDTYAQLAVHVLADLHEETQDNVHMWESIMLLENIVRAKNTNAQLKLLLVKLYSYLGAFAPCIRLYDDLDIRNIQIDSLGYLFVPIGVSLGYYTWAKRTVQPMLLFFFNQLKSCPEYVVSAYHNASFYKIIEMTRFQHRIKNSLTFALDIYENASFEIISRTSSISWAHSTLYSLNLHPFTPESEANLSDNRDLFVMDTWDPPHRRMTKEKAKASTQIEIRWLNVRATMFHTLWVASGIAETAYKTDTPSPVPTRIVSPFSLQEECDKMEKHYMDFKEAYVRAEKTSELDTEFPLLQGPPPSQLHDFFGCGYSEMMDGLVPLLRKMMLAADKKWPQEAADECIKLAEELPRLTTTFEEQRKRVIDVYSRQMKLGSGWALRRVVQLSETFTHAALYVGMCNKVVTTNKAKKRSRVERVAEPMIKALREFQNDLLEEIDKLKRGVDDVRQDVMTDYRREFYDEDYMEMRRFRHRMNRREMEDREFQEIDCTSVRGVEKSIRESCVSKLDELRLALGTKLVLCIKTMKW